MIVVNCRFLTQERTGVQRFAEEITRELVGLRDDLVLVAPPGELRYEKLGGAPIIRIGKAQGHRWEQWDLPQVVRREYAGALLLSLMNTGPVIYRNQIVTHHDLTYARYPETYTRRFRFAYRVLSTATLRRARRVLTVSEFSRSEIASEYGIPADRISVIPNAAGGAFRQVRGDETDPPYMLAVSSLLPHKNIPFLTSAYQRYAEQSGTRTVLKLVGAAQAAGVGSTFRTSDTSHVEFLGRVSDAELQALYAHARAFIFPSLYEGFGIPPLEAQAAQLPVIAASTASIPEVLGDSALYFAPGDDEALLRSIRLLDTDASARALYGARSATNVQRFSWRASAELLSQTVDALGTSTEDGKPTESARA